MDKRRPTAARTPIFPHISSSFQIWKLHRRGQPTVQKERFMPEQLTLNDAATIPQIGLGVWQVDPDITAKVVRWGIEAGYRLIDTAEGYRNEEGVGEAIRAAAVP